MAEAGLSNHVTNLTSFWSRFATQLSHSDDAVKHAIVALGSAHHMYQTAPPRGGEAPPRELEIFTIQQYGTAMSKLSSYAHVPMKDRITVTLLCCVSFVCIESLRNNWRPALTHLSNGLRIIESLPMSKLNELRDAVPPHASADPSEDVLSMDYILRLFATWEISCALFAENFKPVIAIKLYEGRELDDTLLDEFETIADAHRAIVQYTRDVFALVWLTKEQQGDGEFWARPVPHRQHEILMERGNHLTGLFQRFMERPQAPASGTEEHHSICLDMLHYKCARLICQTLHQKPHQRQQSLDVVAQHAELVSLAALLHQGLVAKQRESGAMPRSFTLDIGIIPPLYFILVTCQDPVIQGKALGVLRNYPQRENLWDGNFVRNLLVTVENVSYGPVHPLKDVPHSLAFGKGIPALYEKLQELRINVEGAPHHPIRHKMATYPHEVPAIAEEKTGFDLNLQHGHQDLVQAVAFNAYGDRCATGSVDGKIKVFNRHKDGVWHHCDTWGAHGGEILELQWLPPTVYPNLIASLGIEGRFKLWAEDPSAAPGRRFSASSRATTSKAAYEMRSPKYPYRSFSMKHNEETRHTYLALLSTEGRLVVYENEQPENMSEYTQIDELSICPKPSRGEEISFKVRFDPNLDPCYNALRAGVASDSLGLVVAGMSSVKIYRSRDVIATSYGVAQTQREFYLAVEVGVHRGLVRDVAWATGNIRGYDTIATACQDGCVRVFRIDTPHSADDGKTWATTELTKHENHYAQASAKAGGQANDKQQQQQHQSGLSASLAKSGSHAERHFSGQPGQVKHVFKEVAKLDSHRTPVWRVGFDDDGQILASTGDDGKLVCYRQTPSGTWANSSELAMVKTRMATV
ncbi:nuclear pore protein [Colletotrichum costaricense]|uniref:Nuclear pore protein n=1 Tax=Colletotrichum costaricense TaxID=1209916 RepID=A0AAJ0DT79_9PEZI|nr:nuclear pore protein [Colletotrichum costaricense]KAK1509462.1 nuclear pore protein [Colletotrichum costaricense]